MKKAILVLALAVLVLGLSTSSFAGAQKIFGISNDDNFNTGANTGTIFQVHTAPSALTVFQTVHTGGTGLGGGFFAAPRVSIESNAHCLFVTDAASSDIAAFALSGSSFVAAPGSPFSNGALSGAAEGIGLAASADGKYLYAAYSASENLASWNIASNCSLTLNSGPITEFDLVAPIAVSADGGTLVVSEIDNEVIDTFTLTAGSISATPTSSVSAAGCGFPGGLDINTPASGGALVVAGNAILAQAYMTDTLNIGTHSLGGTVTCGTVSGAGTGIGNLESPLFNKKGLAGAAGGYIYMGMAGFGGGGSNADPGFSVNAVSGTGAAATVAAGASGFIDAYTPANGYIYGSNVATCSNVPAAYAGAVFQSYANGSAANTMAVYAVSAAGVPSPFASVANPNAVGTSFVLSVTSFCNR